MEILGLSMDDIFSSSLTTSSIEGLSLVSSMEHLRAKVMNFFTMSSGNGPIVLSMMENIIPD